MAPRKKMDTILLLIALLGIGVEATQMCYECTGFDADNKTDFYIELVNEMQNVTELPKPIQDQCLRNPNPATLKTCDSYCVTVAATVNLKNLGALDFGAPNDSLIMDSIRAIGNGRMAIRTCLDSLLLNSTTIAPKDVGKMLDIGQEEVCISGQLKISGANVGANFCFCQTDSCNRKQPNQTIAPGDVPVVISDSSYTAACPAPQLNYTSIMPNFCTKNCTSASNCSSTNQLCCNVGGCDYLCANPVYNKPFLGGTCSQMDFTVQTLRDFYDSFTKSEQYYSEVQPNIPSLSKECFNQPVKPTKSCLTLAYAFGFAADFSKSNGQSTEQFQFLQQLIENATSITVNASFFNQLGKMSAVARGCVEDTFPSAISTGFPKIGPVSGCLQLNKTLWGIGMESQMCVCNTDDCNLLPVAPQLTQADSPNNTTTTLLTTNSKTSATTSTASTTTNNASVTKNKNNQNKNAGDRPNAVKSTVIIILPVLLSFFICQ